MGHIQTADGKVIIKNVMMADTFWRRFKGLMFNDTLTPVDALFIEPCQAVHSCFMRIPIDVIFLAKDGRIVYAIEHMKPWSFSKYVREAHGVLECYPGTISKWKLQTGTTLHVYTEEARAHKTH